MGVHVMAEGAIVSRGPVPMHLKPVQSSRGKSGGGSVMSTTIGVDSRKLVDVFEVWESSTSRVWYLVMVQRWGSVHINRSEWGRGEGSRGAWRRREGR
jgi:hypothetical protein